MASYSATVPSPRPADEVFAYLADFRTVAEWDPSITESTRLDDAPGIGVGARYEVVTEMAGRQVPMEYRTVELERPARIVLRGENDSAVSIDTISIAPRPDGGCDVTYEADIELKGARKVGEPVMQVALRRLGTKAEEGLREKVG